MLIDSSCFPFCTLQPYPQTWNVYEDQSSRGNASDEKSVCRSMSLVYVKFLLYLVVVINSFLLFVLVIFSEQVVYSI